MTGSELWLTYCQTSRVGKPCTAQLIELEFQNTKLHDLEDVLDHVFSQGFVEAKYRPMSWWEKKDGVKVKGCQNVEELLKQGVGICQDTALKLVIADIPPALWFSYHYAHHPSGTDVVQRVKLESLLHFHSPPCSPCSPPSVLHSPKLAHLTNYIFHQGYLAPKLRTKVYWQNVCGKNIEEHAEVFEVLSTGEGSSEDKPIRLVIDDHLHCHC
ncbi:hypothetical protein ABKN59_008460 [Abortiporus biennis]